MKYNIRIDIEFISRDGSVNLVYVKK
jgi:hypothetical protein